MSQTQRDLGGLKEVFCCWRCGVHARGIMNVQGWRDKPQSGHTGLEAGCVEGLAFIPAAPGEGLQRLAFG